ncbi:uncharacterized protein LOC143267336 isoform X2 [Peromyscus maniculatus bairdii]
MPHWSQQDCESHLQCKAVVLEYFTRQKPEQQQKKSKGLTAKQRRDMRLFDINPEQQRRMKVKESEEHKTNVTTGEKGQIIYPRKQSETLYGHVGSWQYQSTSEKIWALKKLHMELNFIVAKVSYWTTKYPRINRTKWTDRTRNKGLLIVAKRSVVMALSKGIF